MVFVLVIWVKLKVRDVRYLKVGDTLTIKEGKTGKDNILVINKTVYKPLTNFLDKVQPDDDDANFPAGRQTTTSRVRLSANWLEVDKCD